MIAFYGLKVNLMINEFQLFLSTRKNVEKQNNFNRIVEHIVPDLILLYENKTSFPECSLNGNVRVYSSELVLLSKH